MAWASRNCRCSTPLVNKPRAPLAANSKDTASVQRFTEKAPSRRNPVFAAISGTWPRLASAIASIHLERMIRRAASILADASAILICVLCMSPSLARL